MYFNTNIWVYFNDVQLIDVVSVKTRNDSNQIGSYCDIICPLISRIQYADGKLLTQEVKTLFKQGDKVKIQARYTLVENTPVDEYPLLTVFEGFVLDFFEGHPLTIKCVDSIYNLNFTAPINIPKKIGDPGFTGKLKDLIDITLAGTGVTQLPDTFDMKIEGMTLVNMSPAAVLEHLKKELGINISLIGTQLYVNIASNTLSTVKLDTSVNVKETNLAKKETTFQRIKVKAWFIREDHTKDSFETGDEGGQLREIFFYKIPREDLIVIQTPSGPKQIPKKYKELADEALQKFKLNLYNGTVKTYLYPMIEIFDVVPYKDISYPDRNGIFTCIGRDGEFDISGFNWTYKLAYLRDA